MVRAIQCRALNDDRNRRPAGPERNHALRLPAMEAAARVHSTNWAVDVIVENREQKRSRKFGRGSGPVSQAWMGSSPAKTSLLLKTRKGGAGRRLARRPAGILARTARRQRPRTPASTAHATGVPSCHGSPNNCQTIASHMTRPKGAVVDSRSLPLMWPQIPLPPPVQDEWTGNYSFDPR